MPFVSWLATAAKPRTIAAWIESQSVGYESPLNRYAYYTAGPGARWRVDVEFVPMGNIAAANLRGALHVLDGRANWTLINFNPPDISLPSVLLGGKATDQTAFTDGTQFTDNFSQNLSVGVMLGAALPQARALYIKIPPGLGFINAGTKVAIGDPQSPNYQVVEVSQTLSGAALTAGNAVTLQIRPPLRRAMAKGDTVTIGSVPFKLRLDDDQQAAFPAGPAYTQGVTVRFVEAW